jgi:hypothetical protein
MILMSGRPFLSSSALYKFKWLPRVARMPPSPATCWNATSTDVMTMHSETYQHARTSQCAVGMSDQDSDAVTADARRPPFHTHQHPSTPSSDTRTHDQ